MAAGRSDPGHHHSLADLPLTEPVRTVRLRRVAADGTAGGIDRAVPAETPVAFEVGGVAYAVMMATPADLLDFATGFLLAERLVDTPADIVEVEPVPVDGGVLMRVTLADAMRGRIDGRTRHRLADSSCGLCGVETIAQALRPLPRVPPSPAVAHAAVFAALRALDGHQPLGRSTRAAHAAAWCGPDGAIRLVREDVGRHNAFDKLVGAMARAGQGWEGGFALLTSRLSYELVEKAALAGCPTLAAISAPTDLALARAAAAGIRVLALVRPDALLEAGAEAG